MFRYPPRGLSLHLQLWKNESFGVVGDTFDAWFRMGSLYENYKNLSEKSVFLTHSLAKRGDVYTWLGQSLERKLWGCRSVLGSHILASLLLCNRPARLNHGDHWQPRGTSWSAHPQTSLNVMWLLVMVCLCLTFIKCGVASVRCAHSLDLFGH